MHAALRITVACACASLSAATTGCFYIDPVNQRPAVAIRATSSDPVFRGATVTFEAVADDPEDQGVLFAWRALACTDATAAGGCDDEPIFSGTQTIASFVVPTYRANSTVPVESLRVVLEGQDDHGARARPSQELVVMVLNHPPTLRLRQYSPYGFVAQTPIELYAAYNDPDDSAANVQLDWTAYSPAQTPDTLGQTGPVPPDGGDLQQGRILDTALTGNWDIVVGATDRAGVRTEDHLTVTVVPDAAPCLDTWDPIAAATTPAPITAPTLFQIQRVRDDLDAFPRTSPLDLMGEVEFTWSLRAGTGPRVALPNALSSLAIDPQVYVPGTILELRVEIFDRNATPITCADDAATCSVISQAGCIQRQTWRVEAR